MKQNPGIYLTIMALALPLAWLAFTTDLAHAFPGAVALAGGVFTYALLSRVLWRAHQRGRFAPHHCATCDHAMTALPPGALQQARDTAPVPPHRWVCHHCGRLV